MPEARKTDEAKLDLVEIWSYIAEDNPEAADKLIRNVESRCSRLARSPLLGTSREQLSPRLRSFPHGNYVIFYRPEEFGIIVVRVLHGARDIESEFWK